MFELKKIRANIDFTAIYLLAFSTAFFIQQFLPSYLRYSSIEAISYRINDGWCNPRKDGIGIHCFGDFYYPLTFVDLNNPWKEVVNPYPPFSLFLYKPFELIAEATMPRVALGLFLTALFASLVFPIIHLRFVAREISTTSFLTLFLLTVSFAPAIVSIDRGNNQLFLLPFLYMFFRNCLIFNEKNLIIYGLICVSIKPQFVVLSLVIFQLLGIRRTIKWIIYSGLTYALSFLLYFKSFPINILDWIKQALGFQEYAGRGILMPVNVSLKSDIEIVLNAINFEVSRATIKSVVYLLLLAFSIKFLKNLRDRSVIHNFVLVMFYPLLFTGTTFHYYLSILYIPFLFLLASKNQKSYSGSLKIYFELEKERPSLSKPLQETSFLIFSILCFIPWTIPWSAVFPQLIGRGWDVIGINWLFGQYALLFLALTLTFQRVQRNIPQIQDKMSG